MFPLSTTRGSNDLARSFERLFDESFERFFGLAPRGEGGARTPALDVSESDKTYTVKLDLPGVDKSDVKVSIDGRLVTVQAETKKEEEKKEGERVVYRERSVSSYARSFTLPQEVDEGASAAKLDNGVLTLTLAKKQPAQTKRITVG
ncbi:Hsp20/alpha crystallin family protein [Azohydromonas sp.]|uniref:Hsp20/alpha crystallin family protein n=1 Tax=Azohydromonas sp. TaxID=1872666 RepID=UPI002B5D203C|nr:Hsp20/alpha crystallin family protein [Azohydromonas sp.]HMM87501.1 Hsp20/alpha crystallin family protein [Azohydromonas sp.]